MSTGVLSETLIVNGTAKPKPLSSFARLSGVVSLYEPPKSLSISPPDSPTTILFCSWMDANAKHVEYYTNKYMELYPHARIILVRINVMQFLMETETKRRADVKAAVTALLAPLCDRDTLFVHALSNGGARRVYNIAGAYQAKTGKPLPVKGFIFDSSPGIPQFRRDLVALSVPARKMNFFARMAYMSVVLVVASVVYVSVHWMPKWWWYELVWGPHEGVNNTDLIEKSAMKAFIYSKEDLVIDWKDVEEHARITGEKGFRVEKKLVEGAGHVQLFKGKGGEQDYWGYVKKIWAMTLVRETQLL